MLKSGLYKTEKNTGEFEYRAREIMQNFFGCRDLKMYCRDLKNWTYALHIKRHGEQNERHNKYAIIFFQIEQLKEYIRGNSWRDNS